MKVTKLEKIILIRIIENDEQKASTSYGGEGDSVVNNNIWIEAVEYDCFYNEIMKESKLHKILSSLVKKDLIVINKEEPEEGDTLHITQKGFDIISMIQVIEQTHFKILSISDQSSALRKYELNKKFSVYEATTKSEGGKEMRNETFPNFEIMQNEIFDRDKLIYDTHKELTHVLKNLSFMFKDIALKA